MLLDWLSFTSPAIAPNVLKGIQITAIVFLLLGVALVALTKKRVDRWLLEWLKEVRGSLFRYSFLLLLLSWLSSENVNVLGARVWYVLVFALFVWRITRLKSRMKYWEKRKTEEQQRMQKLKYMPGR